MKEERPRWFSCDPCDAWLPLQVEEAAGRPVHRVDWAHDISRQTMADTHLVSLKESTVAGCMDRRALQKEASDGQGVRSGAGAAGFCSHCPSLGTPVPRAAVHMGSCHPRAETKRF